MILREEDVMQIHKLFFDDKTEQLENLQILRSQYSNQIEKLQVMIVKERQANKTQQNTEETEKVSSISKNDAFDTKNEEKFHLTHRSNSTSEKSLRFTNLQLTSDLSLLKSNVETTNLKTGKTDKTGSGSVSLEKIYSPLEVRRNRSFTFLSNNEKNDRKSIALLGIKPNFVFDAIYVDPQQPSGVNLDASLFITSKHHSFKYAYMLQQGIKSASFFKWSDIENDSVYSHRLSFSNFKSVITNGFPSFFNFEFLVFAPNIFSSLRSLSNISSTDFILSLCDKGTWKLGNNKSGATFYGSGDMLYFIKSISEEEFNVLKSFLFEYYKYLSTHPESLLVRFYGLFGVIFESKTQYYLVMKNVFPGNSSLIKRKYELNGSAKNRKVDDTKLSENFEMVLKDVNFTVRGERICVTHKRKERIILSLREDVDFLCKFNLMDYSLLLGIGETEQPDVKIPTSKNSVDRRNDGGVYSGFENGEKQGEIYYFGIIDILSSFSMKKILDRMFFSVDAEVYKKRFLSFLEALILFETENID